MARTRANTKKSVSQRGRHNGNTTPASGSGIPVTRSGGIIMANELGSGEDPGVSGAVPQGGRTATVGNNQVMTSQAPSPGTTSIPLARAQRSAEFDQAVELACLQVEMRKQKECLDELRKVTEKQKADLQEKDRALKTLQLSSSGGLPSGDEPRGWRGLRDLTPRGGVQDVIDLSQSPQATLGMGGRDWPNYSDTRTSSEGRAQGGRRAAISKVCSDEAHSNGSLPAWCVRLQMVKPWSPRRAARRVP